LGGIKDMDITQLAEEYENQYRVLNAKIQGLRPLLCVYRGEDLVLLRKKIKIYYDMASQCKVIATMLSDYYNGEDIV